jgi:endonuclease/exonuclease/phosphatase family metal-dependent hydrolase
LSTSPIVSGRWKSATWKTDLIARYRPVVINYDDSEGPKFEGFFAASGPIPKDTLKVVSYNIRFAEAVEQAIEVFRGYAVLADADVVLLQEMDEAGTEALAQQLRFNYVYYPACIHNYHGRHFGNAVLAKWPLLHSEKIILPGLSPITRQIRLAAKAWLQVGDRQVVVYSTHTEVYLTLISHRRQQIETLIADIGDEPEYIIAGGDFNTVSNRGINRLVHLFAQVGLERASKGAGPTMLRHAYRPTAADHIFVRGLKTIGRGAVRQAAASDHAPVWVELDL